MEHIRERERERGRERERQTERKRQKKIIREKQEFRKKISVSPNSPESSISKRNGSLNSGLELNLGEH